MGQASGSCAQNPKRIQARVVFLCGAQSLPLSPCVDGRIQFLDLIELRSPFLASSHPRATLSS